MRKNAVLVYNHRIMKKLSLRKTSVRVSLTSVVALIFSGAAAVFATPHALSEGVIGDWPGAQAKNIGIDLTSDLGETPGAAAFYGVGSLYEDLPLQAFLMEARGFAASGSPAEDAGGNFGLSYRRAFSAGRLGNSMAGANMYIDHQTHDAGGFTRWSVGGEFLSTWVDAFGNYYLPITNPRTGEEFIHYSPGGLGLAFHVHAPSRRWLTGTFGYYLFEGESGQSDDEGWRSGVRLHAPQLPHFVLKVEYDGSKTEDSIGVGMTYLYSFLESDAAQDPEEDEFVARSLFFAPAEREYTQRVRQANVNSQ